VISTGDLDPGPADIEDLRQESAEFTVRFMVVGRRGDPDFKPVSVTSLDAGVGGVWLNVYVEGDAVLHRSDEARCAVA